MAKKKSSPSPRAVNIWQMIRDVLIASINKGQFLLALVAAVLCLILWKMSPADVSRLAFEILDGLKTGQLGGWVISPVAIIGWFVHSRWQRKIFTQEMLRVSEERNKWQEKSGAPVRSSES